MELHGKHGSQRSDERTYPESERAAWGDTKGGPLQSACVCDVSASGVGLVLTSEPQPKPGDVIRVMSRDDACGRRARVIRVVRGCRGTTLLGCRWISSVSHPAHWSGNQRRDLRRHAVRRVTFQTGEQ